MHAYAPFDGKEQIQYHDDLSSMIRPAHLSTAADSINHHIDPSLVRRDSQFEQHKYFAPSDASNQPTPANNVDPVSERPRRGTAMPGTRPKVTIIDHEVASHLDGMVSGQHRYFKSALDRQDAEKEMRVQQQLFNYGRGNGETPSNEDPEEEPFPSQQEYETSAMDADHPTIRIDEPYESAAVHATRPARKSLLGVDGSSPWGNRPRGLSERSGASSGDRSRSPAADDYEIVIDDFEGTEILCDRVPRKADGSVQDSELHSALVLMWIPGGVGKVRIRKLGEHFVPSDHGEWRVRKMLLNIRSHYDVHGDIIREGVLSVHKYDDDNTPRFQSEVYRLRSVTRFTIPSKYPVPFPLSLDPNTLSFVDDSDDEGMQRSPSLSPAAAEQEGRSRSATQSPLGRSSGGHEIVSHVRALETDVSTINLVKGDLRRRRYLCGNIGMRIIDEHDNVYPFVMYNSHEVDAWVETMKDIIRVHEHEATFAEVAVSKVKAEYNPHGNFEINQFVNDFLSVDVSQNAVKKKSSRVSIEKPPRNGIVSLYSHGGKKKRPWRFWALREGPNGEEHLLTDTTSGTLLIAAYKQAHSVLRKPIHRLKSALGLHKIQKFDGERCEIFVDCPWASTIIQLTDRVNGAALFLECGKLEDRILWEQWLQLMGATKVLSLEEREALNLLDDPLLAKTKGFNASFFEQDSDSESEASASLRPDSFFAVQRLNNQHRRRASVPNLEVPIMTTVRSTGQEECPTDALSGLYYQSKNRAQTLFTPSTADTQKDLESRATIYLGAEDDASRRGATAEDAPRDDFSARLSQHNRISDCTLADIIDIVALEDEMRDALLMEEEEDLNVDAVASVIKKIELEEAFARKLKLQLLDLQRDEEQGRHEICEDEQKDLRSGFSALGLEFEARAWSTYRRQPSKLTMDQKNALDPDSSLYAIPIASLPHDLAKTSATGSYINDDSVMTLSRLAQDNDKIELSAEEEGKIDDDNLLRKHVNRNQLRRTGILDNIDQLVEDAQNIADRARQTTVMLSRGPLEPLRQGDVVAIRKGYSVPDDEAAREQYDTVSYDASGKLISASSRSPSRIGGPLQPITAESAFGRSSNVVLRPVVTEKESLLQSSFAPFIFTSDEASTDRLVHLTSVAGTTTLRCPRRDVANRDHIQVSEMLQLRAEERERERERSRSHFNGRAESDVSRRKLDAGVRTRGASSSPKWSSSVVTNANNFSFSFTGFGQSVVEPDVKLEATYPNNGLASTPDSNGNSSRRTQSLFGDNNMGSSRYLKSAGDRLASPVSATMCAICGCEKANVPVCAVTGRKHVVARVLPVTDDPQASTYSTLATSPFSRTQSTGLWSEPLPTPSGVSAVDYNGSSPASPLMSPRTFERIQRKKIL